MITCVVAGLTVLIGTLVLALPPTKSTVTSCHDSAEVPSCNLWWGAALRATDSQLPQAVAAMQASTGRRLDLVHTYHRWFDTFPTASERSVAATGDMLLLNWEPTDRTGAAMSWADIANGGQDSVIDATAARIKAAGSTVYITFSHEPEQNFREHGTATDFANAFRHVVDRTRAQGATNIRWVWDVMGLSDPVWLARYEQLWPGDGYVDWIAWDPYNWGDCRNRPWKSFSEIVRPFYDWLQTHAMKNKPMMLAEYGSVEQAGNANGKADWLRSVASQVLDFPLLRALVYFDVPAPPANCDWEIDTSANSVAAFGELARSAPFTSAARSSP